MAIRQRRAIRACLILAIFVCSLGDPPAADYDETETRLKTAGIDAPLRKRIHESIERGVAFLVAAQKPDGH